MPDDWAERWKRFHVPVLVGGRALRAPAVGGAAARPGVAEIVIDPGQAFGTGAHPTTRLCLELLLELPESRPRARSRTSAAARGAGDRGGEARVRPGGRLDSDRAAIEATLANARANGVELGASSGSTCASAPRRPRATVAANLMRPLLLRVAELVPEQPEALIVSGLLEDEADEVAAAFAPLRERRRLRSQGWSACLLTGPRLCPRC